MRDWQVGLLLVVGAFLIYVANGRPIATGDSLGASLIPIELWTHGDLYLDRFRDVRVAQGELAPFVRTKGHWYTSYPVASGLLVAPFYGPAVRSRMRFAPTTADWLEFAAGAEKIAASIVAAVCVALFFAVARQLGARMGAAVAFTCTFALGTEMWSTASQALWQHGPGILCILGAISSGLRYHRRPSYRAAALFGLCSSLAVAVRPSNLIFFVGLWGWLLWRYLQNALRTRTRPSNLASLVVGAAVATALGTALLIHNIALFQHPGGVYGKAGMLNGHVAAGLLGLLSSPSRGILIYFPVSILAVWGLFAAPRAAPARALRIALAASSMALMLLVARTDNWWGGFSWGPRLLSELQPTLLLLCLPLFELSSGLRRSALLVFAAAAIWGALLQAEGALLYTGSWNASPVPIDHSPERLWEWRDNAASRDLQWANVLRALRRAKPLEQWKAAYEAPEQITAVVGQVVEIPATVRNLSKETWTGYGEPNGCLAVSLSWHLRNEHGRLLEFDGVRSHLDGWIGHGESRRVALEVPMPQETGVYRLDVSAVQECVDWFDSHGVRPAHVRLVAESE